MNDRFQRGRSPGLVLYSPSSKSGPFCCSVSGSSPSREGSGLDSRRRRVPFPQTTILTTKSATTYRACLTGRENTVAGNSGRGVSSIVWKDKGPVFSRRVRQLHTRKYRFDRYPCCFDSFNLAGGLKINRLSTKTFDAGDSEQKFPRENIALLAVHL